VIYTSREAPVPRPDELPQRLSTGGAEEGMLIRAIKVKPVDSQRMALLDEMSRLNYHHVLRIDMNVPARVYGQVDQAGLPHLNRQFEYVSSMHGRSA
jgi:hypothetical protein